MTFHTSLHLTFPHFTEQILIGVPLWSDVTRQACSWVKIDDRRSLFFRQIHTKGRVKEDVLEVIRILAMDIV